jgi:glyoxylase-like metal-dependent hydrolase (beta-lactamase superfamily II)
MRSLSRHQRPVRFVAIAAAVVVGVAAAVVNRAVAQQNQNFDAVMIDSVKVRDNVYMLVGSGGNITVAFGPEGALIVDTQFAPLAPKIIAAIHAITDAPIRYIVNSHVHGDHTGGNEQLAKAGRFRAGGNVVGDIGAAATSTAAIIAHENVLNRMSMPAAGTTAPPVAAWPTETFFGKKREFLFNGEAVQIIHQPAAHTDGDVIVFFRRGDVIATGDLIDTTRFPFIDVERGGTLQGVLDGLNRLMDLSIHNVPLLWYPDRTFLVPGHGHVYDKLDLLEYRDALTTVRDRVQDLIGQGMTLAQVQAANPTLGYRSQYGADSGPWTTEMFVATVYNELAAKKNGP